VVAASLPESDRYVTWVTDFLPDDILSQTGQKPRIFFYNYDCYWKRDALPDRLYTMGNKLLENISSEIRRSDEVNFQYNEVTISNVPNILACRNETVT
jgi:hypothetical protein